MSITQSLDKHDQRKNHYVPIFYLRRWSSGLDKKIWYHFKGYGDKLIQKRISPANTAFELGINTLKEDTFAGITAHKKQIVEDELAKLDADASVLLKKLIATGITSLTEAEKKTWFNFVLLLSERAPQRMIEVEREGEISLRTVTEKLIEVYGKKEVWEENRRFLEASHFVHNNVRARLFQFAKSRSYFDENVELEWRIIDSTKSHLEFFTSSSPVITNVDNRRPQSVELLEMALSPKQLWVSAPKSFQFDNELIKTLCLTYNLRLIMLKPRYVYSLNPVIDEKHAKYEKALCQFL